jgi:L-lactate dehydrogenase (cytochrome)
MQHADGEILGARAAKAFGIPFTLSTMSICSLEDIAENTDRHPFWFQLYVMKDRDFIERLIERAKAANVTALQLTLDLQILGQRHKDIKNGLTAPPKPTLKNLIDLATKPRWCMGMLGTKRRTFGNIAGHAKGVKDLSSLSSWTAEQFDPALSWADVEWIKKLWGGKLILKGVMDVEDARLAASSGADALIVSNHGGRQLDGAPSSIAALPAIVDAVGTEIEVWMDGGIRSGQDVLKARALGARGTLIGRSFLYGLGAHGQEGVTPPHYTAEEKRHRIFAIMAASSGNLVEWFDFYVYAFCALYFAPAFFPKRQSTTQLLNTAGVFAAGFLMRPIGGWLFGRLADKHGRRKA